MKCPYRIITKKRPDRAFSEVTEQEFAECYGSECPYYRPETPIGKSGWLKVPEGCRRAEGERDRREGSAT